MAVKRRSRPITNRRKPRELIESIIMDQIERIEAVSHARNITVNEAEFLQRTHKLLINAEATDAEVSALSELTEHQANKLDEALVELMEEIPEKLS